MTLFNVIGFVLSIGIFFASFLAGNDLALYYSLNAFLLVLFGVSGSMFLSYPFRRIKSAFSVMIKAYWFKLPKEDDIVNALLDFALKSKYEGILSLEDETNRSTSLFLKDGLGMVVDGYSSEEMKDVLSTEMYFFKQRREQSERIFRSMAKTAPAFGLIGSVVGLMQMLSGIGDAGVIIRTIPIALLSTLYGILFSNFVFTPIAEGIYARTQSELLLSNVIINGLIAINNEQDTYKLEKKLCSFLSPSVRPKHEKSFKELRRQYFMAKRRPGKKEGTPIPTALTPLPPLSGGLTPESLIKPN